MVNPGVCREQQIKHSQEKWRRACHRRRQWVLRCLPFRGRCSGDKEKACAGQESQNLGGVEGDTTKKSCQLGVLEDRD